MRLGAIVNDANRVWNVLLFAVLAQGCHGGSRPTDLPSHPAICAMTPAAVSTEAVVAPELNLSGGWRPLATIQASRPLNTGDHETAQLTAIAIDDENVYVGESRGAILKIPKVGGTPIEMVVNDWNHVLSPTGMGVDATHIFWITFSSYAGDETGGIVMRLAKSGGSAERIAHTPGTAFAAAFDPSHIYYVDGADHSASKPMIHVRRVPKAGGAASSLTLLEHSANGMVTDGKLLFLATYDWGDGPGTPWRLFNLDPRTSKFSALGFGGSEAMAVDDTYIYWADDAGVVSRMNKRGGIAEKICTGPVGAVDLVADETALYWTTRESGRGKAWVSHVMKVPKTGGEPIQMGEGAGGMVLRVAVDAHDLYWMIPSAVLVHAK